MIIAYFTILLKLIILYTNCLIQEYNIHEIVIFTKLRTLELEIQIKINHKKNVHIYTIKR
jgi:hypothetical protein